tara:strand:- start:2 stop:901 length:900 start_codon:yes stop_codon:yes gene_type:complete
MEHIKLSNTLYNNNNNMAQSLRKEAAAKAEARAEAATMAMERRTLQEEVRDRLILYYINQNPKNRLLRDLTSDFSYFSLQGSWGSSTVRPYYLHHRLRRQRGPSKVTAEQLDESWHRADLAAKLRYSNELARLDPRDHEARARRQEKWEQRLGRARVLTMRKLRDRAMAPPVDEAAQARAEATIQLVPPPPCAMNAHELFCAAHPHARTGIGPGWVWRKMSQEEKKPFEEQAVADEAAKIAAFEATQLVKKAVLVSVRQHVPVQTDDISSDDEEIVFKPAQRGRGNKHKRAVEAQAERE